jgi:hypothetical protein
LEIRNEIYSYLLISSKPIFVLKAWTKRNARQSCDDLSVSILQACRQTADEGVAILYSSNHFQYLLRDDGQPLAKAMLDSPFPLPEITTGGRKRASRRRSSERLIPLVRHASLFRQLSLVLEVNRTQPEYRVAMASALETLISAGIHPRILMLIVSPVPADGGGQLQVVWPNGSSEGIDTTAGEAFVRRRELTVVDFFSPGLEVIKALRRLRCGTLRVKVLTVEHRALVTDLSMADLQAANHEITTPMVAPVKRYWDPLADDCLVASDRAARKLRTQEALKGLRMRIEQACENTNHSIEKGWWREMAALEQEIRAIEPRRHHSDAKTAPSVDASKKRVLELESRTTLASGKRRLRYFRVCRVKGEMKAVFE